MSDDDLLRVDTERFTAEFPAPEQVPAPAPEDDFRIATRVVLQKRRVVLSESESGSEESGSDESGSDESPPKLRRTLTESTEPLPPSPFSLPPPSAFDPPSVQEVVDLTQGDDDESSSADDYCEPPADMANVAEPVPGNATLSAVVFTHFLHSKGKKPGAPCSSSDHECGVWPLGPAPGMTVVQTQRSVNRIVGGGYEIEVSPKTGKRHIQGWFVLENEIAKDTLCKYFAKKGCNITFFGKMRGTVAQSIEYCSKEGGYVAFGKQDCVNKHARGGQGARNDIAEFVEACEKGTSMRDLCLTYAEYVLKHSRGVETIRQHVFVDPRVKPGAYLPRKNFAFFGPSGTGKSTAARFIVGQHTCYIPASNNNSIFSFETYDGQEYIKMEEFSGARLPVNSLKDMAGDDACQLTGRGFSKPGLHNSVVITSNYNPASWYPGSPVDFLAIQRRFIVYYCGEKEWTKSWVDKDSSEVKELKFPNPLIVYKNGAWSNERGPWVLQ